MWAVNNPLSVYMDFEEIQRRWMQANFFAYGFLEDWDAPVRKMVLYEGVLCNDRSETDKKGIRK